MNFSISSLLQGYREGRFSPRTVMQEVLRRIDAADDQAIWISRRTAEDVLADAAALETADPRALPLYAIPFAVKDNIDVAGIPTTAGCPRYSYQPQQSAFVVQRLIEAGAVLIGKTNLDQFATGLVGLRSPYGAPRNPFDAAYIPGGSSSGSAVAVARSLVSFALGTDTAGSGRVPAAFNNVVGLKPTRGVVSSSGVVPACRSLDCVSIFARSVPDAAHVLSVAGTFDARDPFARQFAVPVSVPPSDMIVGIPDVSKLDFFGNEEYRRLFWEAVARVRPLVAETRELDIQPFLEAAKLLYDGPWVAERYDAVGKFLESNPDHVLPVTKGIIERGKSHTAAEAFRAMYRLEELKSEARRIFEEVDALLLPTTGTIYTCEQVMREPVVLNSNLGRYTNFMNLLDLCGVAVPSGFTSSGLPFGITLMVSAFCEAQVLELGALLHSAAETGTTVERVNPDAVTPAVESFKAKKVNLVVCGAHMRGLPLNQELLELGGRFVRESKTAPWYQLFALPGGPPFRPGLVRTKERKGQGRGVAVEVWSLSEEAFGRFVANIPAPLGIGKVELADGSFLSGFLCEAYATADATDITQLGSWRKFLETDSRMGPPGFEPGTKGL